MKRWFPTLPKQWSGQLKWRASFLPLAEPVVWRPLQKAQVEYIITVSAWSHMVKGVSVNWMLKWKTVLPNSQKSYTSPKVSKNKWQSRQIIQWNLIHSRCNNIWATLRICRFLVFLFWISSMFFIPGLHHRTTPFILTESTKDSIFLSESNWAGFQMHILNCSLYLIHTNLIFCFSDSLYNTGRGRSNA